MPEPERQYREVYYAGNVQGVGFRYTVRSLAGRFNVGGFVRNTPDGRVQLAVEGETAEIAAFLNAIQSEMGHYILDVREMVATAAGRFEGFEIRR